jgi:polyferredoxin
LAVECAFEYRREASGISEFSRKEAKEWRKKQIPKIHLKISVTSLFLPVSVVNFFQSFTAKLQKVARWH